MTTTPLGDILAHRARVDGDAPAFTVDGHGTMTFAEWHGAARALATALRAQGVRPGDRIATLFSDTEWLTFCVTYVGVLLAGAVVVPLRRPAGPQWLRDVLDQVGAGGLLHGSSVDLTELPCWSTSVERLAGDELSTRDLPTRDLPTRDLPQVSGADPASIVLTSGTTRSPKAVVCAHASLSGDWRPDAASDAGNAFLTSVAVGSNAAQATLCGAVLNGMHTVLSQEFDPVAFRRLARTHRVTGVGLTPTLARLLIASPGPDDDSFASVETVVSSSAPLDQPTVSGLAAIFPGTEILNVYTLTEGGPSFVAVCDPDRPPALGRPEHGEDIRIVDEAGVDVSPGEVGELLIRAGDEAVRAYLHHDQGQARTDRPGRSRTRFLGDGWIGTGDLCYQADDGTLFFAGRGDDVIISGGFNVAALAVETVLRRHPGVRDAAVFGVPHPVLGEQVVAAVVLSAPIRVEDLRDHCATELRPQERPGRVVTVSELPTTASGKVLKRELRAAYADPASADPGGSADVPATDAERMVADAFGRLLQSPAVGREGDFFTLGGHSLVAVQVAADLTEQTGTPVPAERVLRLPVVRDLAAWLTRRR